MVSDLLKKRYEEIFDDNYHRLYLLARRFVHNEEDAEDIVADVFYDLWRRINDIDLNGGITTYLYRAVSSRALNHLRHQNVAAVRIETLEAINEKRLEFVSKENLEDIIHSKEIKKAIGLALTDLPDKCRKVFILSYVSGLKNSDIAETMDISVRTVESHIYKALRHLRARLKYLNLLIFCFF